MNFDPSDSIEDDGRPVLPLHEGLCENLVSISRNCRWVENSSAKFLYKQYVPPVLRGERG